VTGGIEVAAAGALAALTAPLYADLALCLAGNAVPGRKRPRTRTRTIRLAVVVPAHDEEAMVTSTVGSLQAAASGAPVYVVAHNCQDATADAARAAGARTLELNHPEMQGKAAALRFGFDQALADGANAVLVVDADSTVSANLVAETRTALEAGAELTQCRYELDADAGRAGALARLKALAFRGMNVLRPRGRARLGFSAGLFGNGFALTREALERAPFEGNGIAEDAEYHAQAVAAGLKVEWLETASGGRMRRRRRAGRVDGCGPRGARRQDCCGPREEETGGRWRPWPTCVLCRWRAGWCWPRWPPWRPRRDCASTRPAARWRRGSTRPPRPGWAQNRAGICGPWPRRPSTWHGRWPSPRWWCGRRAGARAG
jgi:hypothetical protein